MSTDAAAFVAKIIAEPDEDTHRLVYADWLQDHGDCDCDSDRAEYIRRMVAMPNAARFYNQVAGSTDPGDVLLRRSGHRWLGPWYTSAGGRAWLWRRGFVETAVLTPAEWCDHAAAILAEHPVRHVLFTSLNNVVEIARHCLVTIPAGSTVHPTAGLDLVSALIERFAARWPGIAFLPPPAEPMRFTMRRLVGKKVFEDQVAALAVGRVNATPLSGFAPYTVQVEQVEYAAAAGDSLFEETVHYRVPPQLVPGLSMFQAHGEADFHALFYGG